MLAEHQWIIAQYPEQAQIDVWGEDPLAVASSSLAPRADARHVPRRLALERPVHVFERLRLAQWAIIGAFLGEIGDPRRIAYLLVPLAETEIDDDWHVLGLAGSGSKSLLLRDVFVPEHRVVMVGDLFAGTPPGALVHPDYPVLRAPRGYLVPFRCRPCRGARRPGARLPAAPAGPAVARREAACPIRVRADEARRGGRRDRRGNDAAASRARDDRGGQFGPPHRGG